MTASTERGEAPAGLRIPDFYVVGHPKSGTTALYEMLRRHPQIFMSELKEPRFFASDLRARFQAHGVGEHPQTIEAYAALFADAAPGQLRRRRLALLSALARRPRPRSRACARTRASSPSCASRRASCARCTWRWCRTASRRSWTCAARSKPRRSRPPSRVADGAAPPELRYTDRVRYVEQLRRYHDAFGREQVLVLIYDDFRADNEGTLRRVQRFLGVDDTVPIELVEANTSVRVRSLRMDDAVNSLQGGRGAVRTHGQGGRLTGARASPSGRSRHAAKPARLRPAGAARSPSSQPELRRRFAPEVVALSEYLEPRPRRAVGI